MRLFNRTKPAVDTVRAELIAEMRIALAGFKEALQKYEQNTDESVAYSQMLFANVEVYRESYYNARIEYEQRYGNIDNYNEKLTKLQQWTKERSILCLFKNPREMYASAKQIS